MSSSSFSLPRNCQYQRYDRRSHDPPPPKHKMCFRDKKNRDSSPSPPMKISSPIPVSTSSVDIVWPLPRASMAQAVAKSPSEFFDTPPRPYHYDDHSVPPSQAPSVYTPSNYSRSNTPPPLPALPSLRPSYPYPNPYPNPSRPTVPDFSSVNAAYDEANDAFEKFTLRPRTPPRPPTAFPAHVPTPPLHTPTFHPHSPTQQTSPLFPGHQPSFLTESPPRPTRITTASQLHRLNSTSTSNSTIKRSNSTFTSPASSAPSSATASPTTSAPPGEPLQRAQSITSRPSISPSHRSSISATGTTFTTGTTLPSGSTPAFPSRHDFKKARKRMLAAQEEARKANAKMGVDKFLAWDAKKGQWVNKMTPAEKEEWLRQWKKDNGIKDKEDGTGIQRTVSEVETRRA